MAKISKEEYEKIKLLPDYDWNWIAREKAGKILSFTNKPAKTDEVWKDKQMRLWFNYKDSQLFQFIKWEDSEPYNIQELIEEYESEEAKVNKQKLIEIKQALSGLSSTREETQNDPVHSPSHYMQGHIETIDKIKMMLTPEEYLGYLKGNVLKYDRAPFKGNQEQDYDKQKVYYDWALEQMEGMQNEK